VVSTCAYRPTSVNVYTVCYHGHMCMCKHAHLYRSASAAGWLTPKRVSTTPSTPSQPRASRRFPRSPTITDNLTKLIVVYIPLRTAVFTVRVGNTCYPRRSVSRNNHDGIRPINNGPSSRVLCPHYPRIRPVITARVHGYTG